MLTAKDPLSEIAGYRQQAVHSTLCNADDRGFCWYLAADEAAQFYQQVTLFKQPTTFSVEDIPARAQSQQVIDLLSSPKRKHNPKSPLHWMFSTNSRIAEPLDYYRYWVARSLEITSPHLAAEKKRALQLFEKVPHDQDSLKQVLSLFEEAQLIEKNPEKKDPLEKAILFHRAKIVAFTSLYLAVLKQQRDHLLTKEKKPLLFLTKMLHCLEQELTLRKNILQATQQGKEEVVRFLMFIATSWNSAKDCYQKAADAFITNPKESNSWQELAQRGEKASKAFEHLTKFILTPSHPSATGSFEHALFLLNNALDYRMQMRGTSPFLNQDFAHWLKQASLLTRLSAFLWIQAGRTEMTFPSQSRFIRLWKGAALYVEYQARNKIQRLVVCNKIQHAQQTFKNPAKEKKYYRKKITQSLLAQQWTVASDWRLAAAEASFFSLLSQEHSSTFLSEQEWKHFLHQLSSQKTFLHFFYQTFEQEKQGFFSSRNRDFEEAIAHYRYWLVRTTAQKNKDFFSKENWLEQLPLFHCSYQTTLAAERLQYFTNQAQKETSPAAFQAAACCAEKVLYFRTQAEEATREKKEEEAQQWILAAYTMAQAAEGHAQFSETSWWKALAEQTEEAIKARLHALKMLQQGAKKRASALQRGAFLLENSFDHELELATTSSPEFFAQWKEVFEKARRAAQWWIAAGSTRWWGKQWLFQQKARHEEQEMRKNITHLLFQKISFCLPPEALPDQAAQEAWKKGKLSPRLEFSVPHAWIYQTWKFLQEAGMNYPLSTEFLEPGIVIGWGFHLMNMLGTEQPFPADVFLVDIIGDRLPHPYSHLYLAQNPTYVRYAPHSFFMPHWPQRNLIPRDPHRGNRFESVAFFGDPSNCAPELQSESWNQRLAQKLDLKFIMQGNTGWHDYSAIDAVVALRDFSNQRYFYKPATKLFNAWLAGVPFIGGPESAYAEAGTPGKDYLVATSLEELLAHLQRLKEDPSFRHQLVENGRATVKAFTQEATLERWKELLQTTLPAYAAQWQKKSAWQRHWFFFVNKFLCFVNFYLQAQ